jgi:uncharacterized membrane protein
VSVLATREEPHLYCLRGISKKGLFLMLGYLFLLGVTIIDGKRGVKAGFLFGLQEIYQGLAKVSCTFPLNHRLLSSKKL